MNNNVECIIIGAGQAGLAMSYCLRQQAISHLVLERGDVAQRWRSERWDSFRLLSPNWQTRLPGHHYWGPDPDGFLTRAEIVAMFERYAAPAPVRTGVTVLAVSPHDGGWQLATTAGSFWARQLVVATGDLDRPYVPPVAAGLPDDIASLHTSEYRNPETLASGGVLVVGAGPSGQQIANELARAGRRVHIAVGRHKSLPRRYRGQDAYWWLDRMGALRRTVDTLPAQRRRVRTPNAVLEGGRRDLDIEQLVVNGVCPHGRLLDCTGTELRFAADLAATLHDAEANANLFRDRVDDYVLRAGLDAPAEPRRSRTFDWAQRAGRTLDLRQTDITTVLWATGFRRDFSWLHAPVLDEVGEPVQCRGVTAADGLYFLGLRWMHSRSSSFLDGVGFDAEHLAERIAARALVGQEVAA